ncbi:molybdate ABC transporter substrate-binding protein [Marinomonas sp. THO17]|uniref:molybdate ABC transporter substrate-binding protein n=1 Tax=Marinomonas sp. THO17 TaxID=3149048 RepID=UPI00336BCABD
MKKSAALRRHFGKISQLVRLGFVFITASLAASVTAAETLRLAVASNFIRPIQAIAEDYQALTGHKLLVSYGSSGKLYAQIRHQAPFDIFLSADQDKPQKLIENQLAIADSYVIYARGQLALWSTSPIRLDQLSERLLQAKHLAIANPKLAPYGLAAQQILQKLSLWQTLQTRLVMGENIGQTYQFLHSGNVDMGFIALSQARMTPRTKQDPVFILALPEEDYEAIKQAGVILSHSTHPKLAKHFMNYLLSPEVQQRIAQFGYLTMRKN